MPRGRRSVIESTQPQVAVPLSEGETHVKARELADVCNEIDYLKANAAEHAGAERKKIRALDKRRRELSDCVRSGTEMRNSQEVFGFTDRTRMAEQAGANMPVLAVVEPVVKSAEVVMGYDEAIAIIQEPPVESQPAKPRRGRPPGSKNAPKMKVSSDDGLADAIDTALADPNLQFDKGPELPKVKRSPRFPRKVDGNTNGTDTSKH